MSKETLEWRTERWPLSKLRHWDQNPRTISSERKEKLKERIQERGYHGVLKIDVDGTVISGNQSMDALLELGWTEVDVKVPNRKLTKKEREAVGIESNIHDGEFDYSALAGFDLEMLRGIGLTARELDKISGATADDDDFDAEEEAKAIVKPVSKRGELYELGTHRLMCGDAADPTDIARLMGGIQADMVFTDPPYNVNYSGRGKNTSNKIKNDHQSEEEFRKLLTGWFASYAGIIKPDAPMYVCYASRTHREFEDALNANGFEVKQQIIWVKKVASMGWGDYRWKHEPILYCHLKGKKTNYYGDRQQYTEWSEELNDEELLKMVKGMITKEELGESTVWRLHREAKYDHPTQKPVKLVSIALRNSSMRGDVVVDLFGGSGSTLIAAENLARRAFLMELDPRYVDVILKRFELVTGKKAKKL